MGLDGAPLNMLYPVSAGLRVPLGPLGILSAGSVTVSNTSSYTGKPMFCHLGFFISSMTALRMLPELTLLPISPVSCGTRSGLSKPTKSLIPGLAGVPFFTALLNAAICFFGIYR